MQHAASRRCLSWLEREVRGGLSQLWECTNGVHTLHVVTRLDENPREWVICYARGTGAAYFTPHFLAVADARGWPIRLHTESRAVVRLAQRAGFTLCEYVLRR